VKDVSAHANILHLKT